ncbi:MAG: D-glycero-beta-D-manno-heptose 1-phosphate adenylyltransferase [Planctomycetota bacterium]|jgi:D-beta-D-heptose 7-phosphate kinase/D-beta-D-heptose 1-phosphate adenosyltransferase
MHDLIELLEHFGSPRIVLLGDFMLDRYVYGDTERVSQEAPVPVLKVFKTEKRVGAAGSVAAGILALGGQVVCVGVLGDDRDGEELRNMLIAAGAETSSLVVLSELSTTIKTRYIGLAQHKNDQQMLRVDEEPGDSITDRARRTLRAAVRSEIKNCQALVIQDHDKGVLTANVARDIIGAARKLKVPVVVDPAMITDYSRYRGATLLTPNRYEASAASGVEITDDASLKRAADQVLLAAEADAVAITLDREGMYLLRRGGDGRKIPTRPRSVYDGTGAGDAVLAMVALAVGEACPYEQMAALANVAGGMEVERFGVVAITRQEMLEELLRMIGLRGGKLVDRGKLVAEITRRRQRGETIAFTNGCFDLLHMGHVRYLQQARELGSCLIVAINSDDSVRRLKGPTRPVVGQQERAAILGALECVDYVTIFEEDTPIPLLEVLRPDILIKGGTTDVVVGRQAVEAYGGKVLVLEKVEGLSTTEIIDRILSANDKI